MPEYVFISEVYWTFGAIKKFAGNKRQAAVRETSVPVNTGTLPGEKHRIHDVFIARQQTLRNL